MPEGARTEGHRGSTPWGSEQCGFKFGGLVASNFPVALLFGPMGMAVSASDDAVSFYMAQELVELGFSLEL
ncbi:hypothetical protein D3C73_1507670 [compost metagenome]